VRKAQLSKFQLSQVSERSVAKSFSEANRVYEPWTEADDKQPLCHFLVIGPRWKTLEKRERDSTSQLENQWYQVMRGRGHTQLDDTKAPAMILEHRYDYLCHG
jgi:hypothetical protein